MYCENCKVGMRTRIWRSKLISYAAVLIATCLVCWKWEKVGLIKGFFKEPTHVD